MKEVQLRLGINDHQPVWLGDLRGYFGKVLGTRDADRDRQAELSLDAAPDRGGDLGRLAKEVNAAFNVRESLINRNPLNERREIVEHPDGGVAETLVLLEMPIDEDKLRTNLLRPPPRHAAANAESLRLVRCGEHNSTADRDGLAAERSVEHLLDRSVEGVEVSVKDGGDRCHPASTQDVARNIKRTFGSLSSAVETTSRGQYARCRTAVRRGAPRRRKDRTRLSGPPATAARPAFHRQRCSIRAQARSCGWDFLTVSTQDRIGLQQPRGVQRKLC